jgi:NDP-sugar pyrophosphorylase family protein
MKAMILAAGLGTRLYPFTADHPKALYPYEGIPLLKHAIDHLTIAGITDIIVNVHHFADQIADYLRLNNNFNTNISLSDETGELLETGGGLKKARWFFNAGEDFIVRNVDLISDLDLNALIANHRESAALATLAVRRRVTSRYFLFDSGMNLAGWENTTKGDFVWSTPKNGKQQGINSGSPDKNSDYQRFAFSGIQVMNSRIFDLIAEEGKFSLTAMYLRLSGDQCIKGYLESGDFWMDIGSLPAGRAK